MGHHKQPAWVKAGAQGTSSCSHFGLVLRFALEIHVRLRVSAWEPVGLWLVRLLPCSPQQTHRAHCWPFVPVYRFAGRHPLNKVCASKADLVPPVHAAVQVLHLVTRALAKHPARRGEEGLCCCTAWAIHMAQFMPQAVPVRCIPHTLMVGAATEVDGRMVAGKRLPLPWYRR